MRALVLVESAGTAGGMERYLQTVLPSLASQGCELRVVARRIEEVDALGVAARAVPWSDEHDEPSREAGAAVAAELADFQPDVVAVHNILDAQVLAAALRARRTVYHLHDHRPFCPNGDRSFPRGGRICTHAMGAVCVVESLAHGCMYGPRAKSAALARRRASVRDAIAKMQRVVTLSRYMQATAVANGCAPERVAVVDPPLADDAIAVEPAPMPPKARVLFAGRVLPVKGLASLVAALARMAPSRRPQLAVAGEGPSLDAARLLAAKSAVDFHALGKLDPRAVREAMDQATLVALPSLWAEPFGLVGIEAFARGRPVVAYDVGGVGEWIASGGIAVPRGDEAALARAVETVTDPANWLRYADAARLAARRYRCEDHIGRLLALYEGA